MIRGFPRPAPDTEGCKVFLGSRPLHSPPLYGMERLQLTNAITHFLPLRQAGVPRRGEGVDKTLCALLS